MSIDAHGERFVLNQFGLNSCEGMLLCNGNNIHSDLSLHDDSALPCGTQNSVILNCCFSEPYATEKKCWITKRELHLDFSYFCILTRELQDSKVFRHGFLKRWCSNKKLLIKIINCHVTETSKENCCYKISDLNEQCSTNNANQLTETVQDDIQVNLSNKISNSDQFEVSDTSILITNSNAAEETLFMTNKHFLNLPAVTLHISGPVPIFMDKRWCGMLHQSVQERIQLDISMSWLSTLGGACSALGDYSPDWASKAALISSQQMKLAWRIGDPHILARCRLYAAIAFIQKGNFKAASTLIRREYDALRQQPAELRDRRLAKMCQGIWVKLLYTRKFGRLT